MKIVLVNPGQELLIRGNNPKIIDKERGCNPPLGILYVASAIEEEGRHEVSVTDLGLGHMKMDDFKSYVRRAKFDVLGVTVTTFTLLDALRVVRNFKDANPQGKVIAGGPHVAIFAKETVGLGCVDVAVKREGEPLINSVLDHIGEPEQLRHVRGICFRSGSKIVDTGQAPFVENLDALPLPNRSLLPYKEYYSLLGKAAYSTTIITSRGCPFQCAFCDRPNLGKKFRCHSSGYVAREIAQCVELGIREFLFYDDTFTVKRQRVLDLCEKIVQLGLNICWDIRTRVDMVDEVMLAALKHAGCCAVHYGVESGSERILKRLNKGVEIDRIREIFQLTKKIGLNTLAYLMVGNPGETMSDIEKSLNLVYELDPDYLHLTMFSPFPATAIYREALEKGVIKTDAYREFAANPTEDFVPPIWDENFTRSQLQVIVKKAYKRFYLRPAYIRKSIARLRSFRELKRKVRAGLSVFRMED